jgi:DNA-directed RNA polymerase specialized sigma subunit
MGQRGVLTGSEQLQELQQTILAAKRGDWSANNDLVRRFTPLLKSLAEKRASNNAADLNKFIEAGKKGLASAAKKYRKGMRPEKFQVFALDFIERHMDRASKGGGGLLSRMFGG